MQVRNRRYVLSRRVLLFWTLFIGLGAVAGSLGMLVDPSGKALGMDAMLPYFQVLPFADVLFQDFVFSGIALLIVNGLSNLVASVLLFMHKKVGVVLGMTFGITLMLWIVIQFIIFPFNFMSTAYFVFGFLQFVTGFACLVGLKQGEFVFNAEDYANIGKDKARLVVLFSRLGYTRKLAYEIADDQGADILELATPERTISNAGFWWCGRFGMHKWGMSLDWNASTLNGNPLGETLSGGKDCKKCIIYESGQNEKGEKSGQNKKLCGNGKDCINGEPQENGESCGVAEKYVIEEGCKKSESCGMINDFIDLSKYKEITICSPIWVFGVSAPIKQFCLEAKGKVKNVNYVLTHFMRCKFENVAKELDEILQVKHKSFKSFTSRFGNLKELN